MSVPSPLYLCVDCGGTKTSAVICDETGEIVGRALGGPSNFSYLGVQPFVDVLRSTVEKALSSATSSSDPVSISTAAPFASVWIGVSGVDSPNDIRVLASTLSPIFSLPPGNRLQVTNDTHLLASPLRMHPELKSAVAVIAGTGSNVVSFTRGDDSDNQAQSAAPLKEMARAGGWGWILGDVGSGFEVGREALREILMRADLASVDGPVQVDRDAAEVDPPSLQSRIFAHFDITTAPDIFNVVYAPDPLLITTKADAPSISSDGATIVPHTTTSVFTPQATSLLARERRVSQLAPLVFRSAFEDGDKMALTVLKRCAGNLARSIAIVLASPSDPVGARRNAVEASSSIVCFGGSLVGIRAYRDLVLEELKREQHVFAAVEFTGGGDVAAAGAKGMAAVSMQH